MRELRVIGLESDSAGDGSAPRVICEDPASGDKFALVADDKLRAAARGDLSRLGQIEIESESGLRPREIQSRIRAGASVEQVAEAAGVSIARVERFAHPVLLERARAAELATAAHPALQDGPSVYTLAETVLRALADRGLTAAEPEWDAWKSEDGRWVAQVRWNAGRSENRAHWRFSPGSHGGVATALDDAARDIVEPGSVPEVRAVPALTHLEAVAEPEPQVTPSPEPDRPAAERPRPAPQPSPEQRPSTRTRSQKPQMPSWEDVLLGVRSGGTP